jgi:cell division protein FtsZ
MPFAKLAVVGIGGAGGNIVSRMHAIRQSALDSHDDAMSFVVCNTDAQALTQFDPAALRLVQLGPDFTSGLGAGTNPDVGAEAATESIGAVMDAIGSDTNLVFLAAGMGGGTGTGAAPVIARACRAAGIVTVALATLPFEFEGVHRARVAFNGVQTLASAVDALVLLPNQRLMSLADGPDVPFAEAFRLLDSVIMDGVQSISDLMVRPALVNLDFADVRTVLQTGGLAVLSTGKASGENRASIAAMAALHHPLYEALDLSQAKSALISIVGDGSVSLNEVRTIANTVTAAVGPEANVIVGAAIDESRATDGVRSAAAGEDSELLVRGEERDTELRVSVIITGIPMSTPENPATVDEAALLESVRGSAKRTSANAAATSATSPFQSLIEAIKKWW